jgi:hypothetical protein
MEIGQIFNQIYKPGGWGDGSYAKPFSGSGSIPENAKPYVDFVSKVIKDYGFTEVLDVGHGDFKMWRDWQFPGINYLGVDVSDEATRIASTQYSNSNLKFITLDLIQTEPVPFAELLISKDCLQHLPNHIILKLIQKFSNYEYLIICNDTVAPFDSVTDRLKHYGQIRTRIKALLNLQSPFYHIRRENNGKIEVGGYRRLDLMSEPFIGVFSEYQLIETLDYDGPKRNGFKKRVYFFRRKEPHIGR